MRPSIRTRLLLLLLPALLLTLTAAGVGIYLGAREQLYRGLDAELAENAWVIALWALAEPRHGRKVNADNVRRELDELLAGLHSRRSSASAPGDVGHPALRYRIEASSVLPLILSKSAAPILERPGEPGFVRPQREGERWHIFTVQAGEPVVQVSVAQPDDMRRQALRRLLVWPLLWWLPVVPLTLGVVLLAVRSGLKPLAVVTDAMRLRSAADLRPIAVSAPLEVAPLVLALNDLLCRLAELLEHERLFNAAAAHELRTPLAGIRLQAESALELSQDATANAAFGAIIGRSEHAERVLQQLLSLAQVSASAARGLSLQSHDLMPLLRELLAAAMPLARQRDTDIRLLDGPDCRVEADRVSLGVLVRNLLENAILYTPPRGHVEISCVQDGEYLRVNIADDGPGLAPELRAVLLEPFERGGSHTQRGSGLGLAIANRIAQLHGGQLELGVGLAGRGMAASFSLHLSSQR